MAIKGMTKSNNPEFPELGQLRKGAEKTGNKPGSDLTYFRFTSNDVGLVETFSQVYGPEPAEIEVFLPHKTVLENYDSWMEEYGSGSMKRRCDGERQVIWQEGGKYYNYQDHGDNPCLGDKCQCKPTGRLKVLLPALGRFGFVTVLTTSIHDIMRIDKQLKAAFALRGTLQGIPFILRREPVQVSTPMKGNRVRTEKWLLSIEVSPKVVDMLLEDMQTRALPGYEPQIIDAPSLLPESKYSAPEPDASLPTLDEFQMIVLDKLGIKWEEARKILWREFKTDYAPENANEWYSFLEHYLDLAPEPMFDGRPAIDHDDLP